MRPGSLVEIRIPALMKSWLPGIVESVSADEVIVECPAENLRFNYTPDGWLWASRLGVAQPREVIIRWSPEDKVHRLINELGTDSGVETWVRKLVARTL